MGIVIAFAGRLDLGRGCLVQAIDKDLHEPVREFQDLNDLGNGTFGIQVLRIQDGSGRVSCDEPFGHCLSGEFEV